MSEIATIILDISFTNSHEYLSHFSIKVDGRKNLFFFYLYDWIAFLGCFLRWLTSGLLMINKEFCQTYILRDRNE